MLNSLLLSLILSSTPLSTTVPWDSPQAPKDEKKREEPKKAEEAKKRVDEPKKPDEKRQKGQAKDEKGQPNKPKEGANKPKDEPPAKPTTPLVTVEELNKKGYDFLNQGKLKEAIDTLKLATKQDPKNIQGFVGIGMACMQSKRYGEAVDAYQAAVNLNSMSAELQFNFGLALTEAEKYEEARMALERAYTITPANVQYRVAIGETYRRDKDVIRAREEYEKALGEAVDNPTVFNALGNLGLQESNSAEAFKWFDAAIRLRPDDVEAQLGKSSALSGLEKHDESLMIARNVIAKLPNVPFGYSALASAYEAKKDHQLAIEQYQKALAIDGSDGYTWGNLGWSQYGAEQFDEAVKSSQKSLSIDPKLAYVRHNLGLIYAVQDKWSEARKEYEGAVKVSALSEVRAAIKDLKEAGKKRTGIKAIADALNFLQNTERKLQGI